MIPLRFTAIGATCLAFTGCATVQADLDKATAWLASPQTQAAAQSLAAGTKGFICGVSNAAILAGQIEAAVAAGKAVKTSTGQVMTASADVCAALGGTVQ